jgi:hypothetical protein
LARPYKIVCRRLFGIVRAAEVVVAFFVLFGRTKNFGVVALELELSAEVGVSFVCFLTNYWKTILIFFSLN